MGSVILVVALSLGAPKLKPAPIEIIFSNVYDDQVYAWYRVNGNVFDLLVAGRRPTIEEYKKLVKDNEYLNLRR